MNLLIINSEGGPDYLADLFMSEMIYSGRYSIVTNYLPEYLFDDCCAPDRLYGRGYTAFAKLPSKLRSAVKVADVERLFERAPAEFFDRVVYSSVWRNHQWMDEVLQHFKRENIIVLDGEDHNQVLNIAPRVRYFKRELVHPYGMVCQPISFGYPSYFHVDIMSGDERRCLLAPCVPGFLQSYTFGTEAEYYNQYATSLFGITTRKAGWDCMRHYEIIRAGCIPYFPDILAKPNQTMANYPVLLQCRANECFEFLVRNPSAIEGEKRAELEELRTAFGVWLQSCGTTSVYHGLLS